MPAGLRVFKTQVNAAVFFFISLMYNSVERNISELDYTGMVITDFSSLFRDSTHSLNDI